MQDKNIMALRVKRLKWKNKNNHNKLIDLKKQYSWRIWDMICCWSNYKQLIKIRSILIFLKTVNRWEEILKSSNQEFKKLGSVIAIIPLIYSLMKDKIKCIILSKSYRRNLNKNWNYFNKFKNSSKNMKKNHQIIIEWKNSLKSIIKKYKI